MKRYNLFAITSLILLGASCEGDKKNLFSIDESKFKIMYHTGDPISLVVTNKKDIQIDSVVYFNNEKNVGTTKNNSALNIKLENQKLGYQNLKAIVYFEGQSFETATRLEMVSKTEPKLLNYTIKGTYPHDKEAFTQGLEFHSGFLYEGTGQKGNSSLRKTDYKTGKVLQKVDLDSKYFGEGITIINGKIVQLTWQENTGFIYNVQTMKQENTFQYDKKIEGWGLTNDGTNIYQSDGTEKIWKMNPDNQKLIDFINVYTNTTKVKSINEMEWIDGKIYANVWQKDAIMIVNPTSGAVEAVVDLSGLRAKTSATIDDTLNGIAYNPDTKTLFVTGKNWDKMFEIAIKH
jgi:glutaminyl-peptide cyclotransferase